MHTCAWYWSIYKCLFFCFFLLSLPFDISSTTPYSSTTKNEIVDTGPSNMWWTFFMVSAHAMIPQYITRQTHLHYYLFFPTPTSIYRLRIWHELFSAKPHSIININGPLLQRLGRATEHPALSGGGGPATNWCRIPVVLSGTVNHSNLHLMRSKGFALSRTAVEIAAVAIEISVDVSS